MLALLLDAHVSPDVALSLREKTSALVIYSLQEWREGAFLREDDDVILKMAFKEKLTLITYDRKTIVPLIYALGAIGREHAGVVFVDDKSIAQDDFGGMVRALLILWAKTDAYYWRNAVSYLKPER